MSAAHGDGGAPLSRERWLAIEAALEAVLAAPPEARGEVLARRCAGDEALRAEVVSLLDAEPATGFLERPALPALMPSEPVVTIAPPDLGERLAAIIGERYAIERQIGQGGMATVHLARDLRHRRDVAIKVLHPELTAFVGAERFLKEIEVTASLQHPHILPLYDSGSAAGLLYYVMPWIDGETLRARLTRERHLPIAHALRIAQQVADALAHAHARGVVHRDVKPENILLQGERGNQHALVADFGIALAMQHAGSERMTRTGISPGTPQYMAPEQAMGDRVIDPRVDVYALGTVTYEMLAGEAPFRAASPTAVMARVLTEQAPSLRTLRPSAPAHVEAAVAIAMARIPADRFDSVAGFAAALDDPALTRGHVARCNAGAGDAARTAATGRLRRAGATLVAVAAVAAFSTWQWTRNDAPTTAPAVQAAAMRFALDADSGARRVSAPAISPDGRMVAYVATGAKEGALHTRRLDELEGRVQPGTEFAEHPFFAPDGRSIGYFAGQALWRVSVDGGKPSQIAPLPMAERFAGGDWGSDDAIVIAVDGWGLYRGHARGGEVRRVPTVDRANRFIRPRLLPGNGAALVTLAQDEGDPRIGVVDLESGEVTVIGSGAGARLVGEWLVFVRRDGHLYRRRFDLAARRPVGGEERLEGAIDAIDAPVASMAASFDVSPNGTRVLRLVEDARSFGGATRLILADRGGKELRSIPGDVPWSPRLSPDGNRVAYGAFGERRSSSDLWVTHLVSGTTTRLTDDEHDSNDPRWSPDGRWIAYSVNTDGGKDLFVQLAEGGDVRRLSARPGSEWPSGWSSDGRSVLYTQWDANDSRDVWLQPANGAPARALVSSEAMETGATMSPDGRWLAYQSDASGEAEIYLESWPQRGRRVRVSPRGGVNPVWRGDGGELFYWEGDRLVAVTIDRGGAAPDVALGERTALFQADYTPGELPMYDVSRDGGRIVLVTKRPRLARLVVTSSWPSIAPGAAR